MLYHPIPNTYIPLHLYTEASAASDIAGGQMERAEYRNDLGLWDSALCDPDTCRSGGIDLPLGQWASG